jgi:hypothetical protein
VSRQTPYFPLGGGLDVVTPIVQIPDGKMIAGDNYEPWINGGYRRIAGFERYDGRIAPSDATYRWATLEDATGLTVGTTIMGDTSGATAIVVAIGEGDYANEIAITKITGTFQAEDVNTGAYTITAVSPVETAPTVALEEAWLLAAQDEYRDDIGQVPGVNPIRGVWQSRNKVYAIRDNAGETAAVIHKATSLGWDATPITLAHTVRFDSADTEFTLGATVTGGSSGATGTVHKIVYHAGATGTGDARGYLALTGVTGTFTDGETLLGTAVAVGGSEQFALPVGGRYDFITANFLAGSDTYRVYAAGGEGPAFEIDENDVVTPILLDLTLGDSPDENNPYLVEEFDGALWLMFPGGSLQKSITGDPLTFNGFLGAAEFGLGDEGTALVNSAGRVLVAFTRRSTHGIFPVEASYQKRLLSDRSGCLLHSAEEIDTVLALDDSGIVDLQRTEAFGDFANATVSDAVQPIVTARTDVAGTQGVRASNQYRILYENGAGVIMRRRPDGLTEFGTLLYDLNAGTLSCAYTCEDENSAPTYWMAGSAGYVYQCERGTSFDGREVESFCRLPFNHQGSPAVLKRYRLAEVEIKAQRNVTLAMAQDRDFGDQASGTSRWNESISSIFGGGGFYDLDNWDEFYWDSQLHNYARFELYGSGRNVSLLLYHRSATTEPFILQGVILHFDPRRGTR